MLLFVITFLIGLNDYGATDSLDGALLSNELKKIKDGVGITYMQVNINHILKKYTLILIIRARDIKTDKYKDV